MIAYLRGKLIGKGESYIVLLAGGVGYKVFTTPRLIEAELNGDTEAYIHTHVREDALQLFGFATARELGFFEMLITVSGVGPKMALTILSAENMDLIQSAIASRDTALFTKIGGVGKKTAEKIILELNEKMGEVAVVASADATGSEDIIKALETLGYSPREIKDVVGKLDRSGSVEEKLRQALKLLSK